MPLFAAPFSLLDGQRGIEKSAASTSGDQEDLPRTPEELPMERSSATLPRCRGGWCGNQPGDLQCLPQHLGSWLEVAQCLEFFGPRGPGEHQYGWQCFGCSMASNASSFGEDFHLNLGKGCHQFHFCQPCLSRPLAPSLAALLHLPGSHSAAQPDLLRRGDERLRASGPLGPRAAPAAAVAAARRGELQCGHQRAGGGRPPRRGAGAADESGGPAAERHSGELQLGDQRLRAKRRMGHGDLLAAAGWGVSKIRKHRVVTL